MFYRGAFISPHRLAYRLACGEIATALVVHHRCRVRRCFNPEHLEARTSRENVLMGSGPSAQNARKLTCLKGHPLSGDNLWARPSGVRECLICKRARAGAHREKYRQRINAWFRNYVRPKKARTA